jgi:uncharacterized protein (TIGR00730 family)
MVDVGRYIIGADKISKDRFSVAIFGSARITQEKPTYQRVYNLAKALAEKGHDVVTGGGPGLMQAANSGHRAGNGISKSRSIGLGIKLPKEQHFNNSVDEKETFMRFTARLDRFMLLSNAVVVAHGGVGTLLELFYTWQLMQVEQTCDVPIILMGDMWPSFVKWLEKSPLK